MKLDSSLNKTTMEQLQLTPSQKEVLISSLIRSKRRSINLITSSQEWLSSTPGPFQANTALIKSMTATHQETIKIHETQIEEIDQILHKLK